MLRDRHRSDVGAVVEDLPTLRVVEALEERDDRALAGSAGADDCGEGAARDVEGEVAEDGDGGAGRVGECYVAEFESGVGEGKSGWEVDGWGLWGRGGRWAC